MTDAVEVTGGTGGTGADDTVEGTGPGRGDDGGADPRLAAALSGDDGTASARSQVLAALATARIFLALSAEALAEPSGGPAEAGAQMSLLSLVSSSGARALPAFLDGQQVQRWRAGARPAPVSGPSACQAVLDDGAAALLLLDPAGRTVAVSGTALVEVAAGRVPVPDTGLSTRAAQVELVAGEPAAPQLLAALGQALAGEPVEAARLLAGPDGPVLGLVTNLPPADLVALADRVRQRIGPHLPATGLDLAVVGPGGPGEPVSVERLQREPPARRRRAPWRR